ncbi:DUF302 domain-containing protein [Catellatospora coxensis]|uniref:DUF302 domain-containing protein n=1 Tax=Catellatospora coxensis TaxID=310354 RepID=A0A8J3KP03_9ACTN|nr:DUF302 domain-containing protein [Catellatospora coxensis]GIG06462.1 hypothetical protein Cco03nite_31620 [Catellatospora coxensis]
MTSGLTSRRSADGVDQTVAAIRQEAESRGATVFAVVDHAEAARQAGLEMPDTQVVILGSPKAGTPLMLAVPDLAIDLPLRILVRSDGGAGSVVSWQEPGFVAERFHLAEDQLKAFATPSVLVAAVLDRQQ